MKDIKHQIIIKIMNYKLITEYDSQMETKKWTKEIPFIKFPKDWEIKITPPFLGAVVRFQVKKGNAETSVYLDCYGNLGAPAVPYWEVYPYKDDTYRCDINDTDKLLCAIKISLEGQE